MLQPGQWPCTARNADGTQCALVLDHDGPHSTSAGAAAQTRPPAGATMTRRYAGKYEDAMAAYQADAARMASAYWYPVNQQYTPGTWGCGAWILAFILFVVLVGLLILVYMLVARPAGELVVTYQYRPPADPPQPTPEVVAGDTMACPRCAETIKVAAKVCRFCGLELAPATGSEPSTPDPGSEAG